MARSRIPRNDFPALLEHPSSADRDQALARWFARHFDPDGVPLRLSLETWRENLTLILEAARAQPFSAELVASVRQSVEQLLRRTRPSGLGFFSTTGDPKANLSELARLVGLAGSPGASTVLHWWKPSRTGSPASAPPLPADHRPSQVFSVLRADWNRQGDWLAVDHRARSSETQLECALGGVPVLGPVWSSGTPATKTGGAKILQAKSGAFADIVEWTFLQNGARRTRTAIVLRGRSLMLLAEQIDGGDDRTTCFDLAPGVEPVWSETDRSCRLGVSGKRPTTQLIPLGLPQPKRASAEGAGFEVVEGRVRLEGREKLRRSWLSLLVNGGKAPAVWKRLTVSEKSKACSDDVACGFRLAWGPSQEGLLIYRSLTKPALRTVLGLQTRAKFLVGRFTKEGRVVPIVSIDE